MSRLDFDELLVRLRDALVGRSPGTSYILLISGHGGAGKSTMAARLVDELGGLHIGTDEFFADPADRGPGMFDLHDWPAILGLLRDVKAGADPLRYRWRWYGGQQGESVVALPDLLVLEGIRLLRPDVAALADASLWIDCPADLAGERAKRRNRGQGDSAAELELWDTKWIPEGKQFETQFDPRGSATWVLSTR